MKFFILSFSVLLLSLRSDACDCVFLEIGKQIKKSDLVIVGTITSRQFAAYPETFSDPKKSFKNKTIWVGIIKYKIAVKKIFKGKNLNDTIVLYSGLGGGDCGFVFNLNYNYIIYGRKINSVIDHILAGPDNFFTNVCFGTKKYDEEEIKRIIKNLR